MESLFTQLEFWHWLTFALVLVILEVFSPGAFFLWLGIAAACVGIVMTLRPGLSWQAQMIVFAVLSVASIALWRLAKRFLPEPASDVPNLNRRAEQYTGRSFDLVEPIINGNGKIKVDDSTWRVRGEDAPVGSLVKVTGVDGIVFEVEIIKRAE